MLRRLALWLVVAMTLAVPRVAAAQTVKLTIHVGGNTPGAVMTVSGGFGSCSTALGMCTIDVNAGATVRLAATAAGSAQPGRFSGGTGPAAGCALSTCTFTMTSAADVTATFTSGDGPVATLSVSYGGNTGYVVADGVTCQAPTACVLKYLTGSAVHLDAAGSSANGVASVFTGYTDVAGMCDDTAPICDFTLSGSNIVTANFATLSAFTVTPVAAATTAGGAPQSFTATGAFSGGSLPVTGGGGWAAGSTLPFPREFMAAATLGGKIYALGGLDGSDPSAKSDVAVYTPGNSPSWTAVASLLTPRAFGAAVAAGNFLYAIGGRGSAGGLPTATVERYDPALDAWTPRAPMSSPRSDLVAGVAGGVIYAAGGFDGLGGVVSRTLEAYDPASDAWTTRAPMPAGRSGAAGGMIDGILYVVGGYDGTSWSNTVYAYDPQTNAWSAKSPMPAPLSSAASTVADGVLYVFTSDPVHSVMFAYDPVRDAWTVKAPPFVFGRRAAAPLDGVVYAIGGAVPLSSGGSPPIFASVTARVDVFTDSLRWSSSAPSVARIDQTGVATPLAPGTVTITAHISNLTCGANCATLTVLPPTQLSLDIPSNHSTINGSSTFTIGGWAINRGASSGTGVDAVHVYVQPAGGSPAFLGAAYGTPRSDIGAIYGSQFTNSGFMLQNVSLAPGSYTILAFAHDSLTGTFDAAASASITVTAPVSNGLINVDSPTAGQVVTSAFEVGGWALDAGAPTGTGIDGVQFYVQPSGAPAPGVFIGTGSYGIARPDVGAIYGARFTNVGFHFTVAGLGPGTYTLNVVAHSTVTGSYSIVKAVPFTVNATALMSIDIPAAEATVTAAAFDVGGWSIDRNVESTALSGSGVDAVHVYAYPNPGSGEAPIFLGVATLGVSRPDVGAAYGARYDGSGYSLTVDRAALGLAPGVYNIAVSSHSAVSGTFNNIAVVRVTIQ
jgi:hypothetical protein